MAYIIKREAPVKGLSFIYIDDPKFRVDSIIVRMLLPMGEKLSQQYQMLGIMMGDSNAVYPDKSQLSEKLKSLYGAGLRYAYSRAGDRALLSFSARGIADRFTIDGEKISVDIAQLFLDMVFSPNVKDGAFDKKYFDMAKREIIEAIRSAANNRHSYAIRRAREVAFEGEPAALSVLGEEADAEKLTAEQLYETYKKVLSAAGMTVIFCGSGENAEARELVKRRFTEFAQQRISDSGEKDIITDSDLIAPSPLKPEVKEVRESIEQEQLKLVMSFKTDGSDYYAEKVASAMYGGTSFSKLFANVREKLSLCYYCQSVMIEFKDMLLVDSGVDTGNEQMARKEILHQLELLREGEFTDEELENTKKSLCGSLRIVPDSIEDINIWYYLRLARGLDTTPEQDIERINAVTRERVIAAAKGFKLDSVYVLEPKTEEGGEQ